MQLTTDNLQRIDFAKGDGLLPALVQDVASGQIRMQGYMNAEALSQTLTSGLVTFYSRSKERLWVKGESSGNVLKVVSVHSDCDNDSLLILAQPVGPTCHLGTASCFADAAPQLAFLAELEAIQGQRLQSGDAQSYTARLAARGINKVAQKVGEEGVEVALAAVAEGDEALLNESADLLYHLLLTLRLRGLSLADAVAVLKSRH
ncbi:bifunctional phosphoribosyl-AMP cyclohydrolase/phosphoribosyl-ATP diphosphatase HisIE [Gallaecimonas sp. GXIMD1310]|uniref:bifunctional phosphoribosyl-AMP cyclohydrolase/phosphoribosyl-ATP diphosphatase HisIE n=1 Tax=Gallaecimonas sp. GXIMD1310 TaxID=3131926 RepID=UPI00324A66E7